MKRKMIFMAATAVSLLGLSGPAHAYFAQGELIQVVYQNNGANEVATDLGAFAPTTAYAGPTISYAANLLPAAGAAGAFSTATWSNLQVAYFVGLNPTGLTTAWVSGQQAGQTSGSRQGNGFLSNATALQTVYGSLGTAQGTILQSNLQSYWNKMDKGGLSGAVGSFGGFIPLAGGEQNLGAIATTGFVDSYLYYYASPNSPVAGTQVATIRTYADGHTDVLGASPVPIPAPVLLLGSGLLSLVGIRRRQTA